METAIEHGIECKPGVCGGRPVIAGTRMTVKQIAVEYAYMGMTPDDIVEAHPHLSPAQVHDALAFYYRRKADIDREIAQEDKVVREVAKVYGITLPA